MARQESALPDLLERYLLYRKVIGGWKGMGDIRVDLPFLQPTTLLPLWAEAVRHQVQLDVPYPEVKMYVDTVTKDEGMSPGTTYLPLVRLPRTYAEAARVTNRLKELTRQARVFQVNPSVFDYVLSELVDNIYQHAQTDLAFALAQYYPAKNEIEIGFLDSGITIPGSLGHDPRHSYPPERHFQAILDALDGTSSKGGSERGYGLGTSLQLMTRLEGKGLIVSGRGAVLLSGTSRQPYALSEEEQMPGTLISIQLPDGDKEINLYEVVEG